MSVDELKQMFDTYSAQDKLKIVRHEGMRHTSTIAGYALLLTTLPPDAPEYQQYLEKITNANQALWNVIVALTG